MPKSINMDREFYSEDDDFDMDNDQNDGVDMLDMHKIIEA